MTTPYSETLILSDNLNGPFFIKLREICSKNLTDDEFIKIEEYCEEPKMYIIIKSGNCSYIQTGFLRKGMQVKVTFGFKTINGNEPIIKRVINYLSVPTRTNSSKKLKNEMELLREELTAFIETQYKFQQAVMEYMRKETLDDNIKEQLEEATESLDGFRKKYGITGKNQ